MNLIVHPINNQPKFGAKKISPHLSKELKYIPNIPCACCGKKVIMPETITKAFRVIAKPLSKMIEKGYFAPIQKHTEIWNIIERFSKTYPNKSLDKILENIDNYHELKSAVNHSVMEEENTPEDVKNLKLGKVYQDLLNRSRNDLRGSGVVMKRLEAFKPFLTGKKLETFEQLQIYAKKYPRKSLSEILSIEEIYKYHNVKDLLQRAQTKEKQNYHFENILDLVKTKTKSPEIVEEFKNIKEESLEIMTTERDSKIRSYNIKSLYEQALNKHGLGKLKQKVFEEVDKIPTSFITTDSFLVFAKNHKFHDIEIVYSLINPFMSSFEHIIPNSQGGENTIHNGIVLCRECNMNRSSIPYSEFIKYHPEMSYNLQKQIDYISKFILNGKLDDEYKYWPIKISRLLYNYSEGKLNPNASDYCKKLAKKSQTNIETRTDLMAKLNQERENKLKEKEELLKQINDLDSDVINLEIGVDSLRHDNNVEYNLIKSCESYILRGNESGRKKRNK